MEVAPAASASVLHRHHASSKMELFMMKDWRQVVMKRFLAVATLSVLVLGCADRGPNAATTSKGKGVNVQAPGVEVNVDPGGRTDVKAPGVNVEAGPAKTTKRN